MLYFLKFGFIVMIANYIQQQLQIPNPDKHVKSDVTLLNRVTVQQNVIFVQSPFLLKDEIYSALPTMYTGHI